MSSKIPQASHHPPITKKPAKDAGAAPTAGNNNLKSDVILKSQKENIPRKNIATKPTKGVPTRYGQQAELRDQNQHLLATNEQLQKDLIATQERVAELELQFSDLQTENADVRKQLKDCHFLLTTAKVDPVLGEKVGEAAQRSEDQRKEVMGVSTLLLQELKAFGENISKQQAQLETIQAAMAELTTSQEHMMQERENFLQEAAEMEKVLKEAETLVM